MTLVSEFGRFQQSRIEQNVSGKVQVKRFTERPQG